VSGAVAPAAYPPEHHILRDLRLTVEHRPDGTSTGWMPVTPHICHDSGAPRIGVLSILVDVVGGGLAAVAARPDWIATADLTLHLTPRPVTGEIEALGRVLRRGRTTVVIEVSLREAGGAPFGVATMSFAVLPRREENLSVDQVDQVNRMTMARADSALDAPFLECVDLTVIDAEAGVIELPLADYVVNSLGAIQGGMMAAVADAAAEHAVRTAIGASVESLDLQITYLALAKVGPVRTRARLLHTTPEYGTAHVEIFDTGADDRITTVATVVASLP
jgi:uncharacterized protein (TIGR00369 family)